ncbi:hypothetical protein RNJ44_03284 [Nakaseomyces bracarensis]|uniref:F-box domain-containing protein n=1 Tax=Nakaseomyces bracarensis TaxID=273131 RepID=A0ABR4NZC3_9SACH
MAFNSIFNHVVEYLNQNDLCNLALCSKDLSEIVSIHLYHTIHICKDPILRSEAGFLDSNCSYISGYRSVLKSPDQNDMFLFDRIQRLLESSHLKNIKRMIVNNETFSDINEGMEVLLLLLRKVIELDRIEDLDIRNAQIFKVLYEDYIKLSCLKRINIFNWKDLKSCPSRNKIKILKVTFPLKFDFNEIIEADIKNILEDQISFLEINDLAYSSNRVFTQLKQNNIKMNRIIGLSYSHVHHLNIGCVSKTNLLECVNLAGIQRLELTVNCEEPDCTCLEDYLSMLAPELTSLRRLSLSQKHFTTPPNHQEQEDWDVQIGRFILRIPDAERSLTTLIIRHDPPFEGFSEDSVDGNYIRRRNLYSALLPKLKGLKELIAPVMLQTLSAYEVLVADLLWNGCECEFCKNWLPIFDQYIMNHQYYSKEEGDYKDIIPTPFSAFSGFSLSQRTLTQINSLFDITDTAPMSVTWDFHTYENIRHFSDYDCHFDERLFGILATVISHFFNGYMDYLAVQLPRLQFAHFSGIYYTIDSETRKYYCVYD